MVSILEAMNYPKYDCYWTGYLVGEFFVVPFPDRVEIYTKIVKSFQQKPLEVIPCNP